jgi:hypothetical protein
MALETGRATGRLAGEGFAEKALWTGGRAAISPFGGSAEAIDTEQLRTAIIGLVAPLTRRPAAGVRDGVTGEALSADAVVTGLEETAGEADTAAIDAVLARIEATVRAERRGRIRIGILVGVSVEVADVARPAAIGCI